MSDASAASSEYEWVSVDEAARRLNRSVSTVRRMCEREQLTCAREARTAGDTRDHWRVRVTRQQASLAEPPGEQHAPAPTIDPSAAIREAVAPLRAELVAQRERHAAERAADASEMRDLRRQVIDVTREAGAANQRASDASARATTAEATLATERATSAEQARALDDARREIERLRARPWWRKILG